MAGSPQANSVRKARGFTGAISDWWRARCGGVVFSTGKSPSVHHGDAVTFMPQKDGLWLWTLRADYETVVDFLQRNPTPPVHLLLVAPLPAPPVPVINLDQETAALGSERLRSWKRRYGGNPRAFA